MKQRFIIHIDDEDGSFDIETPDGAIPLEDLLYILDSTIHTLVEANNNDEDSDSSISILDDEEEDTPSERYVSGDREPKKEDLN